MLAHPQYAYMLLTALASVVMILVSMFFVRSGSRQGETTLASRLRDVFAPDDAGERRRRPRRVWRNPIAWREAPRAPRPAGARPGSGCSSCGIGAGFLLLVAHYSSWAPLSASQPAVTRHWLTVLTWIELAVILLVVTNTAASTLTREKEPQTIELLLSTPLTSQYIVAGMLRGLVSFALPMIAVPTSTLVLFALGGLFSGGKLPGVVPVEAALLAPLLMVAYSAMAAMVGLQFSLISKKTVQAVMLSTAVGRGAAGLLFACGVAMKGAGPIAASVVLPFTPFPAMQALIDAQEAFNWAGSASKVTMETARATCAIFALISAAAYLALTYSIYKNMVRGFDMTVRRQTA